MNDEINTESQQIAMEIIANSGEAKGQAFQAIRVMREEKDYEKARELLKSANEYAHIAHVAQTKLLTMTATGEEVNVDVLLVHSQDHLMTTILAIDLIEEMIEMIHGK